MGYEIQLEENLIFKPAMKRLSYPQCPPPFLHVDSACLVNPLWTSVVNKRHQICIRCGDILSSWSSPYWKKGRRGSKEEHRHVCDATYSIGPTLKTWRCSLLLKGFNCRCCTYTFNCCHKNVSEGLLKKVEEDSTKMLTVVIYRSMRCQGVFLFFVFL